MALLTKDIIKKGIMKLITFIAIVISVIAVFTIIYEFGFPLQPHESLRIRSLNNTILVLLWFIITLRMIIGGAMGKRSNSKSMLRYIGYGIFTSVSLLVLSVGYGIIQSDNFINVATSNIVVILVVLAVSVAEISAAITRILNSHTNPAAILSGSFALIIFIGSMLLMLPNCNHGLAYIDSLFISSSAVCVTGLSTVDITQILTTSGLVVLMLLIQVGGLGIMTITSFFGLFFAGGGSLSNQVMVSELLSGESLNGLLRTILKIIVVTLCVEAVGATLIYFSVVDVKGIEDKFLFAAFHAVSAFCNAGFSTLSGNMYDPLVRNIGSLMWIMSFLVIFGGIGFPIFANLLSVVGHHISNMFRRIFNIRVEHRQRLWSLNTFIVVRFTIALLLVSYVMFLILEWNHSLIQYGIWDKLSQGFLMAVTPRTAGFNGVNLTSMVPASILITIVLMWIGGAPQSTAGGVKVTTVYLAMKNIFSSSVPGRNIEVNNRSIPNYSVRRAFAVIALSFVVLSVSVILLSIFEPEIEISRLIFEAVSALGTVGLTLDVTSNLGSEAKVVVILLMYIGRVGAITLFAMFIRRNISQMYTYPEENILIN